ncbi:MAG: carbohydrate ABC transporter permease [Anaerolineales bacterium]
MDTQDTRRPRYTSAVLLEEIEERNPRAISRRFRWEVHIPLSIICFVLALPVLYALIIATQTAEDAYTASLDILIPGGDLANNVQQLFDDRRFGTIVGNTLLVTFVVVIGKTVLAMLAGLAFVYFRFPGKWVLFFAVLLTLLMPTEIILLPLFDLVADLGWGEQHISLALTVPFLASAAGAFLFRQHFSNIPREMVEAAQMDGATPLRFMVSVLIPMSWNVIIGHGVLQFIAMWNQYLWPSIVAQDPGDQLIQQGVRNAVGSTGQPDFGLLMTAGIVASIPPLIVFIILQKQFMSGFALTRDK